MTDLTTLLQEFYRDKLVMMLRHIAAARVVPQYDANNTYQYIINREETQLSWIAKSIEEQGGAVSDGVGAGRTITGKGAQMTHVTIEEDARDAQIFVDRWRPRVDAMTHARHAKMLRVILGEVLEAKRFFEQALAGRTDLLGRRADTLEPASGVVLAERWIE